MTNIVSKNRKFFDDAALLYLAASQRALSLCVCMVVFFSVQF